MKGIFALLDEVGFEGALALEIEPEDTTKLPVFVKQSYQYITNLLDELGSMNNKYER